LIFVHPVNYKHLSNCFANDRATWENGPVWAQEVHFVARIYCATNQTLWRAPSLWLKLMTLKVVFCSTKVFTQPQGKYFRSYFCNKLADKLMQKVAAQTNITHFCHVCQTEICRKPQKVSTNSLQLCVRVCQQICCTHVMVETHL
jgi:hypothetical protein